jgi:hypothetical protein
MMALELKPPVCSLGGLEALVIVVIAARKINMDPVARSDPSGHDVPHANKNDRR